MKNTVAKSAIALRFSFLAMVFISSYSIVSGQARIQFTDQSGSDFRSTLFSHYSLATVDLPSVYDVVNNSSKLSLSINSTMLDFSLQATNLLAPDYKVIVSGKEGTTQIASFSVQTYTGWTLDGKTSIVLTIDKDFFQAMIQTDGIYYFIEQMDSNGKFVNAGELIYYNAADYIDTGEHTCAVTDFQDKSNHFDPPLETRTNSCGVVELAIASDHTMYDKYNSSTTDVANHNIAVMNNVAFNYRHEFTDNIEYQIVAQYISTTYNADPLSPNTDTTSSSILLNAFTTWGQGGGFGSATYDIGQFWSNRDFDGSTIGLAWVGTVCTSNRYHVLQDFSSDANLLRVMTAHEIGHNFNAGHDSGSGYIMSPSVSNTNVWSSTSVTSISSFINIITCLASCSGNQYANFVWSPTALCNSGTVLFKDKSINNSSRTWSFPSGSPNTSTAQQPSISYSSAGSYQASVTTGNGLSTKTVQNAVIVGTEPNLNTNGCALPSGTPGSLGPRLFTLENLYNPSGNASTDGSRYMNFVCSDFATLKENTTYNFSITVGDCGNNKFESFEVYIDYNNDGDFLDSGEKVYDYGNGGVCGTWTKSFTTPATVPVKNTILRMRVISDEYTNDITGPCYNPIEGQTEDYGVIFQEMIILPLDLISFTGHNESNTNILNWKTAHEDRISDFEVQRSVDGKNFYTIGTVVSALSTREFNSYTFRDGAAQSSGAYYRLKINEQGGSYAYSQLIYIGSKHNFEVTANYNRNSSNLDLNITSKVPDNYLISVFSVDGKEILFDRVQIPTGEQKLSYPMGGIIPGLYILKIGNENGSDILQKILIY